MQTKDDFIKAVAVPAMGGIVWNPLLKSLLPQEGEEAKKVQEEIVSAIAGAMRAAIGLFYPDFGRHADDRPSGGLAGIAPEEWRVECERAAFHAGKLLRLARIQGGTAAATVEMVLTAPRTEGGLEGMPETTLFARVARDAQRYSRDDRDNEEIRSAIDYFTKHLAVMPPERRRMMEASLTGTFMGWLMP